MKIRLLALAAVAMIGLTGAVTAMPRHHQHQQAHSYDALVGAPQPYAVDHFPSVLSTGDTRTTATGGPSGGIN